VKITREKGKYHISPLLKPDLANEMSIAKPEGEVKLTDRMATYYLAAAGGTWTRDDSVSRFFILSSIMLIAVSGILDRAMVTVKRSKDQTP
jgi:hypothetical protein